MAIPRSIRRLYGLMAILCLPALFWIATLIPPIQSPDEYQHLYRAYLLSTGQVLLHAPGENQDSAILGRHSQVGGNIDRGLLAYKEAHWPLVLDPQRQLSADEQIAVSNMTWQHASQFVPMPGTGYYFPLIYVPQALGLLTGQWLDLRIHQSYWLSRIFSTITCLLVLGLAIKTLRPPPLAWALLFLPMTVFQLLSPTIDGLTISLSMLTLSLFLRACFLRHPPDLVVMLTMAWSLFLLTSTRAHLLPLLALPFYLAWKHRHIQHARLACATSVATVCWMVFAIATSHDDRVQLAVSPGSLLRHYMVNPVEYLKMVWSSLSDPGMFMFYERSFVGILGWLNVSLPQSAYATLWLGLALCAVVSLGPLMTSSAGDRAARWLLVVLAVISMGLVFLAMLITWTPAKATYIEGVQGRYFAIPAMMLAYATARVSPKYAQPSSLWVHALLTTYVATSLWALTVAVLARYD